LICYKAGECKQNLSGKEGVACTRWLGAKDGSQFLALIPAPDLNGLLGRFVWKVLTTLQHFLTLGLARVFEFLEFRALVWR
jgi:hypothetical protein